MVLGIVLLRLLSVVGGTVLPVVPTLPLDPMLSAAFGGSTITREPGGAVIIKVPPLGTTAVRAVIVVPTVSWSAASANGLATPNNATVAAVAMSRLAVKILVM